MNRHSKTDWGRVRKEADKPVPFDPKEDLYDPNDEKAVRAFWAQAKASRPGRPPVAVNALH